MSVITAAAWDVRVTKCEVAKGDLNQVRFVIDNRAESWLNTGPSYFTDWRKVHRKVVLCRLRIYIGIQYLG